MCAARTGHIIGKGEGGDLLQEAYCIGMNSACDVLHIQAVQMRAIFARLQHGEVAEREVPEAGDVEEGDLVGALLEVPLRQCDRLPEVAHLAHNTNWPMSCNIARPHVPYRDTISCSAGSGLDDLATNITIFLQAAGGCGPRARGWQRSACRSAVSPRHPPRCCPRARRTGRLW